MITLAVGLVAVAGEIENFAEQSGHELGDDAQGFEIAGARGFNVDEVTGQLSDDGVDAEFITSAVNGHFVRSECVENGDVFGKLGAEGA